MMSRSRPRVLLLVALAAALVPLAGCFGCGSCIYYEGIKVRADFAGPWNATQVQSILIGMGYKAVVTDVRDVSAQGNPTPINAFLLPRDSTTWVLTIEYPERTGKGAEPSTTVQEYGRQLWETKKADYFVVLQEFERRVGQQHVAEPTWSVLAFQ